MPRVFVAFVFTICIGFNATQARAETLRFDHLADAQKACLAKGSPGTVVREDRDFEHYYVYTWYPGSHAGQYPPGRPPAFYIKSNNPNFNVSSFSGPYMCFVDAEQAGYYDRDTAQLAQIANASAPAAAPAKPTSLNSRSTLADATAFCGSASDVVWDLGRTDIARFGQSPLVGYGIYATAGAPGWQNGSLGNIPAQFNCLSHIPNPREDYATYFNQITASRAATYKADATPTPAAASSVGTHSAPGPHVDIVHDLTGGRGGVILLSAPNANGYHEAWEFSPAQMSLVPNSASKTTALTISGNGLTFPFTINALISQDGGNIVAQGGGNIVAQGGGNIVAAGGGNIVAQGGGNIVAQGGGNIVAQGGGNFVPTSLISQDGSGLISKFSSVISNDGGSLQSMIAANISQISQASLISLSSGTLIPPASSFMAGVTNFGGYGLASVDSSKLTVYKDPATANSHCSNGIAFANKDRTWDVSVLRSALPNVLGYACKDDLRRLGWRYVGP